MLGNFHTYTYICIILYIYLEIAVMPPLHVITLGVFADATEPLDTYVYLYV